MIFLLSWFQASESQASPGWYQFGLFAIIGLIFYFLLIRPQMKQQKDHRNLVSALKKGDKIITNGGMWAEIDTVETQTILIKLNDKTKIKINRTAIAGFQPKPGQDANK